jgi:hypothetical protein
MKDQNNSLTIGTILYGVKSKDNLVSYFLSMNGIFQYIRDSESTQGTVYDITLNVTKYKNMENFPGGFVLESDKKGKIFLISLRNGLIFWMDETNPSQW